MKKLVIILFLILLAVFVATWIAGSSLSAPVNQSVGNLPEDLKGETVEFQSESGTKIKGWLIKSEKRNGVIILMHGVRANRSNMIERARFLNKAGYSILAFDFQSHGESVGNRITFGCLESKDAQAAVEFIRKILPQQRIGVIGISMGGAAFLLTDKPLVVDSVILEMVYPTMQNAVEDRLNARLFNGAGILAPFLTWQFKPRLNCSIDELKPIEKVGALKVPKLFIVGSEDKYTTLEESKKFFDSAIEPKEFLVIEGAKHEDLLRFARIDYERKVLDFFEKTLRNF